jgi:nitrite reductase/ring-hydroxylating ferredoxin subunit
MLQAPASERFPIYPISWYLYCHSSKLARGPISREFLGKRLVAFRTGSGRAAVLDAPCCHLGGDLGRGRVVGDAVQCPFHHWEFGADGRCVRIPAQEEIPALARQAAYPVQERHGFVFFFNGREPNFPLPFFHDCRFEDFTPARPFGAELDCSWFLVNANAFDLQHFQAAHDRQLTGPLVVDCPAPFARQVRATFIVAGSSLQDRLTRLFAGDQVSMSITDYCGNIMIATATFRRTRSYVMIFSQPLAAARVRVQVVVFVPRSRGLLGRVLRDRLQLWVRRLFFKRFFTADAEILRGTRYSPYGLIDCDRDLAEYFSWLAETSNGRTGEAACAFGQRPLSHQESTRQQCVF